MRGKYSFTFSARDFAHRGMSTASDTEDGAFSPDTDAVNLTAKPGVMYPPASPTDTSTNVTGNFIASSEDFNVVAGQDRYFVDDAGAYYIYNGSTITKKVTDGVGTYTPAKTDMIPTVLGFFTTTTTDITLWNGNVTFDANYWTTTKGKAALNANVPHPMIIFEKFAWIGDGNKLHKIDESGNATYAFLTLESTDVITALGIDPGTGKMLISVSTGQNISDTLNRKNKVHYFDGFSNKPTKTVIVEDLITAFLPNGGNLYCCYGQNFGEFIGSGLKFLRKLSINLDNGIGGLIYKQRITNIGTTVYIAEKTKILAFGEAESRQGKIFYYAYGNNVNSNSLGLIVNVGGSSSPRIGISFATNKFYVWDPASIASNGTMTLWTNMLYFDNPIQLRSMKVFYKNGVNANVNPGSLTFYDENGFTVSTIGNGGLLVLTNTTGAAEFNHPLLNVDCRLDSFQLRVLMDTAIVGIRRIVGRYDLADI